MEIILNGAKHQLDAPLSIFELVANLNLAQQAVAVAVNRDVITRNQWKDYRLQANDQVDVVRAIGGG
jgi:sulfur carrier protein